MDSSSNIFVVNQVNVSKKAAVSDLLTTGIAAIFVILGGLLVIIIGLVFAWDGFVLELRGATVRVPVHLARDPVEIVTGLVIILLGLLVLYGFLRYYFVDVRQKARRYAVDGKHIIGEIVECSGHATEDDYSIQVRYRFKTPEGQDLVQEVTSIRNDLKDKVLPEPGSLVSVIYINDAEFKVL